ncbi:MAG: prohibitin family protein [Saprospiraceae bacterium]|nr:prohibitin family protein [Saprospiraceae bacterium]
MAFIIIGLFLFVAYWLLGKSVTDSRISNLRKILRIGSIGLIVVGFLTTCVVQVEAGYIGVKKLFGKVQEDILHPGLHLINPFIKIELLETRIQNYTMSAVIDEGHLQGDDAIRALTRDGLEIIIDISVLYKIDPPNGPKIINEIGPEYQDRIVRPITRSRIRDFAVYYEAIDLYSKKREEFQQNIFKTITEDLSAKGLVLEGLLIRNIELPKNVKTTIEEKIQAEQESQKMQFVLQKEKQEADRKRLEAQGIADYQKIINTGLTDKQLQYERIKALKELSLSQNSKIIVTNGNNNPVLINSN